MIGPDELALNRYMDEIADCYGYERVDRNFANRFRLTLVLRHITKAGRVLDIGCANGLYLRLVAPHCAHITGIDINERVLARARVMIIDEGIANAIVLRRNARKLDTPDASFDLAYCFATLSVVPDDLAVLREIARVLRPGGRVILDITGRFNLSQRYWRKWWEEKGIDFHAYRYGEIARHLRNLGLVIIEAHAMGVTDQWRSVPLLKHLTFLDRLLHGAAEPDLDYRLSNLRPFFPFGSRWYLVCQRCGDPRLTLKT